MITLNQLRTNFEVTSKLNLDTKKDTLDTSEVSFLYDKKGKKMRAYLNEIYQYLITNEMRTHMRDELHLSEDHKKIFDSLSKYSGDSNFHYDNTMIPRERFEYLLKCMSHRHVEELIRLAEIGLKAEREQNRIKTS